MIDEETFDIVISDALATLEGGGGSNLTDRSKPVRRQHVPLGLCQTKAKREDLLCEGGPTRSRGAPFGDSAKAHATQE